MIIGSIDIGSNTVLMLIASADPETEAIKPMIDVQRIPRISEGLTQSGEINSRAFGLLMPVLKEYFDLLQQYKCQKILISGTNAFRAAANGSKIKAMIESEFQTEMKVLTGEEEAELAFLGTSFYGKPGENRLVIDIGGGSTEIIYGSSEGILFKRSFDVGVVSLSERYSDPQAASKLNTEQMQYKLMEIFAMLPDKQFAPAKTIALAGTPVVLAGIYKGMTEYNEYELEGSILTKENIAGLYKYLSGFNPAELLKKYPQLIENREDLILSGTTILLYLLNILELPDVLVSTYGIRYGAIIKYLRGNN
jgi:exopolyphosphatase/guanosine-5'-triphosphate,3'-diphosphate pyrophosphatase